jgi:Glyoxalase/Bleomycin resistance protein/Dioxygenase superfamily
MGLTHLELHRVGKGVTRRGVSDKIHHVCIVVHDIEKARAYYESIGIGPWQEYPPLVECTHLRVPNPSAFLKMRYQICNMPTIQFQLCPRERIARSGASSTQRARGFFISALRFLTATPARRRRMLADSRFRCAGDARMAALSHILIRRARLALYWKSGRRRQLKNKR